MATAAELALVIKAEGVDDATKKLGGVTSAVSGMSKAVGGGMLAVGGIIAGVGAAGLNAASQIVQGQQDLQAQLGMSAEQAKRFGDVGTEVFKSNWGESIGEAQNAVGQFAKAFAFDIPIDQLKQVTQQAFAVQGAFDFPVEEQSKALGILSANFQDVAADGTKALDQITKLMQDNGMNADDLLETLGEYSPLMAQMGMTSEQFFGVLSSGLQAGARDTDFVADLFKEFGIRIADGSDTTQEALDSLNLGHLTAQISAGQITGVQAFDQIQEAITKIDDPIQRNVVGVALMGTKYEDLGQEVVAALDTSPWGDFEGAAMKAGDASSNSLSGAFETIKRTALTSLGEALTPFVTDLREKLPGIVSELQPKIEAFFSGIGEKLADIDVGAIADRIMAVDWAGIGETVAGIFGKITDVISFLAEHPGIAMFIGAIVGIGVAIGPLIPIITTVVSVIGTIAGVVGPVIAALGGFGAIIGSIAALFNPVTLAIGAVVAIIVGLKLAWDNNLGGIQEKTAAVVEWIKGAWAAFTGFLSEHIDTIKAILITILTGGLNLVWEGWQKYGGQITQFLADMGTMIQAKWDEFVASITTALTNIGTAITTKWTEFWTSITTKLSEIGTAIQTKWAEFLAEIQGALASIGEQIKLRWDAFLREIQDKLDAILGAITTAWDAMRAAVEGALAKIHDIINSVWQAIGDIVDSALKGIQDVVNNVLDFIEEKTGLSLGAVKEIFNNAMGAVRDAVAGVIAFFQGDWAGALSWFKEAAHGAREAVTGAFTLMKENVIRAVAGLVDAIKGIPGSIVEAVKGIGVEAAKIGQGIMDGIAAGINSALGAVKGALDALKALVPDWLADILGWRSPARISIPAGMGIAEGIAFGITAGLPKVLESLRGIADAVGHFPIEPPRVPGLDPSLPGGKQWSSGEGKQRSSGGKRRSDSTEWRMPDSVRARPVGEVTARPMQTGRGGFIQASSSNYWQIWVQRYGVPTEASARKMAAALGIPLPKWLEDMFAPGPTGGVGDLGKLDFEPILRGLTGIAPIMDAAGLAVAAFTGAVGQATVDLGKYRTLPPLEPEPPPPPPRIIPPDPPRPIIPPGGITDPLSVTVKSPDTVSVGGVGSLVVPSLRAEVTTTVNNVIQWTDAATDKLATMVERKLAERFVLTPVP